jgi:hypothetical protein
VCNPAKARYATDVPCFNNAVSVFTGCHLVATAAVEDGSMVALTLPLFIFCLQALVTLIAAQNPGKFSMHLLIPTFKDPETRVQYHFMEKLGRVLIRNLCNTHKCTILCIFYVIHSLHLSIIDSQHSVQKMPCIFPRYFIFNGILKYKISGKNVVHFVGLSVVI